MKTKNKQWTQKEIAFVRKNYPNIGAQKCVNELKNVSCKQVQYLVQKLGIKKSKANFIERRADLAKQELLPQGEPRRRLQFLRNAGMDHDDAMATVKLQFNI